MAWALTRSAAAVLTLRGERGRYSVAGANGRDLLECVSRSVRPAGRLGPRGVPVVSDRRWRPRPRAKPPASTIYTVILSHRPSGGQHQCPRSVRDELIVDLVALGPFPGLRFGVLGWMRLARALAARRGMWLLAERLAVGIGRVARVRAALVGIRPLAGIRLPHGIVQGVVRLGVL